MNTPKLQAGFSIVEAMIILVIVGAVSFVGYSVYDRANANRATLPPQASQKAEEAVAKDVPAAPAIDKASDLDKASATLDQIDVEAGSDQSQLDAELNQF